MKLYLRFEGYPRIGLGAIYKKEQIRRFLESECGVGTIGLISARTAPHAEEIYAGETVQLQSPPYSRAELDEVAAHVAVVGAGCCITGLINAPPAYMSGLQECLPVLAVEDQPTPGLDVWGVLNHSPVEAWHRKYGNVTHCYLGPQYSLLRPAVLNHLRPAHKEGLVVTMGGANYSGSTVRVARALRDVDFPVTLIMGPSFAHEAELREAAGTRLGILRDPPDFVARLAGARLVVSQGGSTLYELAHLGTPPVVLGEDPHEITLGDAMAARGFGRCLGDGIRCSERKIVHEITALMQDSAEIERMREAGRALDVGRGWEHFRKAVEELLA